jgi:hypothetical protein
MALKLPVFVILPGRTAVTKRSLKLGWVVDFDDEARLFLILFSEAAPPSYTAPVESHSPFNLHTDKRSKSRMVLTRDTQQRFKFQLIKRYGLKCAVCDIRHPTLIKAAHICPKADRGSDDWRNGLPLCANHHDAFDGFLFGIEPGSQSIRPKPGLDPLQIGLLANRLAPLRNNPHDEAIAWR